MRCPHIVATGAENVSQAFISLTGFSVQGDSPAADNLTHKFLLRYYLFKDIIPQYLHFSSYFCKYYNDLTTRQKGGLHEIKIHPVRHDRMVHRSIMDRIKLSFEP